jgi:hypothetical protein
MPAACIAMRVGNPTTPATAGLYFPFGDHLGSTTLSYRADTVAQAKEL